MREQRTGPGGERRGSTESVALLQDPTGKGGIASVVAAYRAWAAIHRPGAPSYYLDDAHGGDLVALCRWQPTEPAVPRVLPRLHLPMYPAARWRMRRVWEEAEEVHVIGAHVMHGALAPGRVPSVAWLATLIDDERRPTLAMRSVARRSLYRATLGPLSAIERSVLEAAGRILAMSVHTADLIVSKGIAPARRVEVRPVPVDTDLFTPPGEAVERSGLLFVGRPHDPRKGFSRLTALLDASAPARTAGVSVVSSVDPGAGAGVRWLGRVADLPAVYQGAELLVLPSRQEGLGIVALEAMACATPVVAYRCGGPERILTDSGGGLIVDDDHAFRATVEHLIAHPEVRAEMGQAGRRYAERHLSLRDFLADGAIFQSRSR